MRFYISLTALLIFLGGCSYFNDPGSELILNVDNEFEIDILENLVPDGRELTFVMTAIKEVMCKDSELILESEKSGGAINISINDILMLPNCQQEPSFPSGKTEIDMKYANYDLVIKVKDHTSQSGFLKADANEYIINLDDTKGFILNRTNLKRIPDQFAWGHYHSEDLDSIAMMETFLSDNNLVTRPLVEMDKGFYSYFSIDGDGIIRFEDLPYRSNVGKIALNNIDMDLTKELFQNYKTANPGFDLTLFFSDGTVL